MTSSTNNPVLLDVPIQPKLTPMQKQYTSIKQQYPDVLLMFRMGDFYEMFGEDAEIAAPILEIVLTSRDADKTPMCGVPYHSVDRYISKLLAAGRRVAVCDQVEDPKKAKGLVKREVTRVVSAGTVLEDAFLPQTSNNFLVSLASDSSEWAVAVADISTGEFLVTQFEGEGALGKALSEIERLRPAECVISELDIDLADRIRAGGCKLVTPVTPEIAFREPPRQRLLKHFGVASLRGYGCDDLSGCQSAASLLLEYLERSNASALAHLRSLSTYSTDIFMQLDTVTRKNLELTVSQSEDSAASLIRVLDKTRTPMGARRLRLWIDQPLLDLQSIHSRQNAVETLVKDVMTRGDIREHLSGVQDIERIVSRASTGVASPRDLIALAKSLEKCKGLNETVARSADAMLASLAEKISPPQQVIDCINSSIQPEPPLHLRDGGVIRNGYNTELDELRDAARGGKEWIAKIEMKERDRTGLKNLKVRYNSVFGYYIEVSKANLNSIPGDYIRKQTTTNTERYITPELKEHESKVLGAEERAVALEQEIFAEVRQQVSDHAQTLLALARAVSETDALASLAETAHASRWTKPEVDDSRDLFIQAGRHPVVERSLGISAFVPNDSRLNCDDERLLIITGPNMAGKSTYLRQVALIVLLAQVGCFVPADRAKIGLVDRIFTRIGARDELASGQSTFMVEMNETANILNNASDRSLILLDEIGRGTSTYDGLSIAWAVAEHILLHVGAKTLFATHYHQLNTLATLHHGVKNYRVAVKEEPDRIIWLHKIMPGGTDRSYGVQVARLAGLPDDLIKRAEEILQDLERQQNQETTATLSDAAIHRKQMTLFEEETPELLQELLKLDIATMSPVEALNRLWSLQKIAEERYGG